MSKLKDRILSYEESSSYKILPKLPLIISVNGRNFSSITNLLDKPFDTGMYDCLASTMKRLCVEIEGAVFGYLYNDNIIIISRNDQNIATTPWYNNNIQKLTSVISSISTFHFNKCADHIGLQTSGDPLFYTKVFPVPSVIEAINTIIYYQQLNFTISIHFSCYYELIKKYNKSQIKNMLVNLSQTERIELLKKECNVDFKDYSSSFRRGSACFKDYSGDQNEKSNWIIVNDLPIFTQEQSFLKDILN